MAHAIGQQSLLTALLLITMSSPGSAADPTGEAPALAGLWSGSWGGGRRGEVVFQPVIAELYVKGDLVELHGFRNANRLSGRMTIDAEARKLRITVPAEAGVAAKTLEFSFELKNNLLTLTDTDRIPVQLQRYAAIGNPLANVQVDLVTASGINVAGDLLVTEFTTLRAGRAGETLFRPENRVLKTRQASVFQVQDSGVKPLSINEARRLIQGKSQVAVAYRADDRAARPQLHVLWRDAGPPPPDSDAVQKTLSKLLRPGTLVFVLSARENLPQP